MTASVRLANLPGYWVEIGATSGVLILLPVLLGWPRSFESSAIIVLFALVVWTLDPLVTAIGVCLSAFAIAIFGTPEILHWMPQGYMVWLTIAIVLFVRNELALCEQVARTQAVLKTWRAEQQEWRRLFDNSPAAIITTDAEGRVIMANPAANRLLGCDGFSIVGAGIGRIVAALGAALRIDREHTVFQNLTGCTGWRPNGEMFVADAWFSIGQSPAGTRLCAVIVDAGERLQERARGGLRSSMATSQIAMGAVLHEIRNLSAAAGVTYNNVARTEFAQAAGLQHNTDFEALGSLLKALSGLAAAELRPGETSYGSVNLSEVLAQLRIIMAPWFEESEMTVNWNIAPGLPEVLGDESGLLQLFLNLAQNSNKAMLSSDVKQLTIDARIEGDWVVVRFSDTGPGVASPDDLFKPFQRSSGVKGLGLFVSRAIARSFHGDLKFTPDGSGSSFTVELLPLREWQKVAGPV